MGELTTGREKNSLVPKSPGDLFIDTELEKKIKNSQEFSRYIQRGI